MTCPFQDYDYYGDFRREEGGRTEGGTGKQMPTLQQAQNYASGGAGYWLSRKAFDLLLRAPVTGVWRDEITTYAEDLWVGNILGRGPALKYFDDRRFVNHGSTYWPNPGNDAVTAHLSCPAGRYEKSWIYSAHEVWRRNVIRLTKFAGRPLRRAGLVALGKHGAAPRFTLYPPDQGEFP